MRQQIAARITRLKAAELERTVMPCPCCRGVELMVVKQCKLTGVLPEDEPLGYSLIVCKTCGDMRQRCDDLGRLAHLDGCLTIRLPEATPHPFR